MHGFSIVSVGRGKWCMSLPTVFQCQPQPDVESIPAKCSIPSSYVVALTPFFNMALSTFCVNFTSSALKLNHEINIFNCLFRLFRHYGVFAKTF